MSLRHSSYFVSADEAGTNVTIVSSQAVQNAVSSVTTVLPMLDVIVVSTQAVQTSVSDVTVELPTPDVTITSTQAQQVSVSSGSFIPAGLTVTITSTQAAQRSLINHPMDFSNRDEWIRDVLGKDGNTNDLWVEYWISQAVPSGQFNDMAHTWLGDLGFTKDLANRWFFWEEQNLRGL